MSKKLLVDVDEMFSLAWTVFKTYLLIGFLAVCFLVWAAASGVDIHKPLLCRKGSEQCLRERDKP